MKRLVAFGLSSFLALAAAGQSSAPSPWGTVPSITVVSGNYQQVHTTQVSQFAARVAGFGPLQVIVKDGRRQPLKNVPVVFTCQRPAGGYCSVDPRGAQNVSTFTVNTDANGVATLDSTSAYGGSDHKLSVVYYDGYGSLTVVAAYGMFKVTFNLTVLPDPWTTLAIVSGDSQKLPRNSGGPPSARFAPVRVALRDSAGRGVANVQVAFLFLNMPGGMRCQMTSSGYPVPPILTDSNGMATLDQALGNSLWCYFADGPVDVMARAGAVSARIHFTVGP